MGHSPGVAKSETRLSAHAPLTALDTQPPESVSRQRWASARRGATFSSNAQVASCVGLRPRWDSCTATVSRWQEVLVPSDEACGVTVGGGKIGSSRGLL